MITVFLRPWWLGGNGKSFLEKLQKWTKPEMRWICIFFNFDSLHLHRSSIFHLQWNKNKAWFLWTSAQKKKALLNSLIYWSRPPITFLHLWANKLCCVTKKYTVVSLNRGGTECKCRVDNRKGHFNLQAALKLS